MDIHLPQPPCLELDQNRSAGVRGRTTEPPGPLLSGRSAPRWLEANPKTQRESPDFSKPENETDRLAALAIDPDARVLRALAHQLIERFSLHTARDTSSGHVLIRCLKRIDLVFVDAHLVELPDAPLLVDLAHAHPLAARVLLCRAGDCSLSPIARQWSHLLMWKPFESATLRAVENAVLWHPHEGPSPARGIRVHESDPRGLALTKAAGAAQSSGPDPPDAPPAGRAR